MGARFGRDSAPAGADERDVPEEFGGLLGNCGITRMAKNKIRSAYLIAHRQSAILLTIHAGFEQKACAKGDFFGKKISFLRCRVPAKINNGFHCDMILPRSICPEVIYSHGQALQAIVPELAPLPARASPGVLFVTMRSSAAEFRISK